MVMTHKRVEEAKEIPIIKKEDNPERKFMPKAKAVKENKILADERAEQEKLKADQLARRKKKLAEDDSETKTTEPNQKLDPSAVFDATGLSLSDEEVSDLKAIEEEYKNASGPGSTQKKNKLLSQAQAIRDKG